MATTGTYSETFGERFQFHILAVCARTPGYVQRFRSALDHAFFAAAVDRAVAKALFGLIDDHQQLPHPSTLVEACRESADDDEMDAIGEAIDALYVEDITDIAAVEKRTVEFGQTQAMINAVLAAADEITDGHREKVIPLIQDASMVGHDLLSVGERYRDWDSRKKWYLAPPDEVQEDVIPTGLPHLDYALGGGLRRGELGVVVAPPKKGKTTTLINFGFGALTSATPDAVTDRTGFNVLHLSLEMHQDQILRRFDDRLAGEHKIKLKRIKPKEYVAHLEKRMPLVLGDLYVKSYPTRSLTPSGLRSLLTLLASQGFTPDLLVVDYADIMKAERRMGETRHEAAGIYEDLRTIAGEFNVACWTGSQASKGAMEKETITIADFAESFEKAAIVDCAIGFCQNEEERRENPQECRLFLAAYRNQEDERTIHATIRRDCCRIKTTSLVDPAHGEIHLPSFDDAEGDGVTQEREVTERPAKLTKRAKTAKPSPTLKKILTGDRKPQKKYPKKPAKQAKPGAKKRAKPDRPRRNVGTEN